MKKENYANYNNSIGKSYLAFFVSKTNRRRHS